MEISAEAALELHERAVAGLPIPYAYPDFADWLEWATGDEEDVASFMVPDELRNGFRDEWINGFRQAMEIVKGAYEMRTKK